MLEQRTASKDEVKWRYGFQLVQSLQEKTKENPKKKRRKPKAKSIASNKTKFEQSYMTNVECKALIQECKRTLKAGWSSMSDDSEEEEDSSNLPSNFKKYTIQDRKIILQPVHGVDR